MDEETALLRRENEHIRRTASRSDSGLAEFGTQRRDHRGCPHAW
jgi:hypothetical protein